VFTAFARAFREGVQIEPALGAPARLPALPADLEVQTVPIPALAELGLTENPRLPKAGEGAARARLGAFLEASAANYHEQRDRLDLPGTSRLSQGERFDPEGAYVRRYLPELAELPAKYVHAPWSAPALVLSTAGVRLGRDYPFPIVEHSFARKRFRAIAESYLSARRGA
jgi:deoxyribodipyrimidine photolyase